MFIYNRENCKNCIRPKEGHFRVKGERFILIEKSVHTKCPEVKLIKKALKIGNVLWIPYGKPY